MKTNTIVYTAPSKEDLAEKQDRETLAKATVLLTKVMEDWADDMDEWLEDFDEVLTKKLEALNERRKEGTDHDGPAGGERSNSR